MFPGWKFGVVLCRSPPNFSPRMFSLWIQMSPNIQMCQDFGKCGTKLEICSCQMYWNCIWQIFCDFFYFYIFFNLNSILRVNLFSSGSSAMLKSKVFSSPLKVKSILLVAESKNVFLLSHTKFTSSPLHSSWKARGWRRAFWKVYLLHLENIKGLNESIRQVHLQG